MTTYPWYGFPPFLPETGLAKWACGRSWYEASFLGTWNNFEAHCFKKRSGLRKTVVVTVSWCRNLYLLLSRCSWSGHKASFVYPWSGFPPFLRETWLPRWAWGRGGYEGPYRNMEQLCGNFFQENQLWKKMSWCLSLLSLNVLEVAQPAEYDLASLRPSASCENPVCNLDIGWSCSFPENRFRKTDVVMVALML